MKDQPKPLQNALSTMLLAPEDFGYVMGPDGQYVLTEEGRRMQEEAMASLEKERTEWRKRNPSYDYSEAAARRRYRESLLSMPESLKKACLNWDHIMKKLNEDDES